MVVSSVEDPVMTRDQFLAVGPCVPSSPSFAHTSLGLNALEAFQKTGTELPVNLKFCFEGFVLTILS
jgi:hypothetical protein